MRELVGSVEAWRNRDYILRVLGMGMLYQSGRGHPMLWLGAGIEPIIRPKPSILAPRRVVVPVCSSPITVRYSTIIISYSVPTEI